MSGRPALVLSCEHAGADVPARWRDLFAGHEDLLATHRALDLGAADLARALGRALGTRPLLARVTRLLVDTNRSPDHPAVFSEFTRDLGPPERARLIARHHAPHRARVERAVADAIVRRGRVLHLGVHSFTPVLEGKVRDVDVALLYDPARAPEAATARAMLDDLRVRLPDLRVRANQPYRGTSDGLTTSLRGVFPASRYSGIELEVSQALLTGSDPRARRRVEQALVAVLAERVAR